MITHPPSFPQEARTRLLSPVAALPTIPGSSLVEALAPQNSRSGSFLSPVPSQYTGGQDPRDYDSQTPERMLDTCPARTRGWWAGARPTGALQLSGTPRARGPPGPEDPGMVRAGVVGTHLPTSGLDIFGDLRKMNKRQVRGPRGGRALGVRASWARLTARTAPQPPRRVLGPGFQSALTHLWARLCALSHFRSPVRGGWSGRVRRCESSPMGARGG